MVQAETGKTMRLTNGSYGHCKVRIIQVLVEVEAAKRHFPEGWLGHV